MKENTKIGSRIYRSYGETTRRRDGISLEELELWWLPSRAKLAKTLQLLHVGYCEIRGRGRDPGRGTLNQSHTYPTRDDLGGVQVAANIGKVTDIIQSIPRVGGISSQSYVLPFRPWLNGSIQCLDQNPSHPFTVVYTVPARNQHNIVNSIGVPLVQYLFHSVW